QLLVSNPANTQPNDLTNGTLAEPADFMTYLAPPTPPRPSMPGDPGQAIFNQIGCAQCHTPTFQTGVKALSAINQVTFSPYPDFLVHDRGRSVTASCKADRARARCARRRCGDCSSSNRLCTTAVRRR